MFDAGENILEGFEGFLLKEGLVTGNAGEMKGFAEFHRFFIRRGSIEKTRSYEKDIGMFLYPFL